MRFPPWIPLVLAALAGCTATPLPTPPSADPKQMSLTEGQGDRVVLTGAANAIRPGGAALLVRGAQGAVLRPVGDDGSFVASLRGTRSDVLYLDRVEAGVDTFLLAVTGGPGETVVAADAGADADSDDSPDAVDCDPGDPARSGRECGASNVACTPVAELCNGLDDDCDGTVDGDVCGCAGDDGCGIGQSCNAGTCSADDPANAGACQNVQCSPGQICQDGVCAECVPVAEVCNGLDDDCDGQVDEDACDPACAGIECPAGQACQQGVCVPCQNGAC